MSGSGQLLIAANDLAAALESNEAPVVVDCRFDLLDPAAGRTAWAAGHIPGAFYADLDQDLAAPRRPDSGRHPLPDPGRLAELLGSWGLQPDKPVVAYDDVGGAVAARLWWLLRWVGHTRVALLDGGLQAWQQTGLSLSLSQPSLSVGRYPVSPGQMPEIDVDEVVARMPEGDLTLLDARDPVRFAGGAEPIDPVAGHVPGAVNRPFTANLDAEGCFKAPSELAGEFAALLGDRSSIVASMCGSGVTACHNLFAMQVAGLPVASLYVGSWSEWVTDPDRPVGSR